MNRREFFKLSSLVPALFLELKYSFLGDDGDKKKRDKSSKLPPEDAPAEPKETLFLQTEVQTPKSLMLHRANKPLLKEFRHLIAADGLNTITYSELYALLLSGQTDFKKQIIISIDDLNTSWLSEDFEEMVEMMEELGMRGVLGINTPGSRQDAKKENWQYLSDVQERGWELAIHTEDHLFLPGLSDSELRYQIEETYQEILENTGKAPRTLILPFGGMEKNGVADHRITDICRELGIDWIVGIQDVKSAEGNIISGKKFTAEPPYFVGRIGPNENNPQTTFISLKISFEKDD